MHVDVRKILCWHVNLKKKKKKKKKKLADHSPNAACFDMQFSDFFDILKKIELWLSWLLSEFKDPDGFFFFFFSVDTSSI